ncbi:Na+/H+ antiporter subunit E [Macrococcus brunensis]|uniref:Na+/H+ antiporter subunit E n=1 Tax=Macrococcus brunensis TaxID=198483 RepID=A0A4R6BCB7_9STAP|nr:Na+/H+ antiporter subunit E [Macrococcus brunensis]TDL95476.1 Na+/H+ antiporter subunit E [Macrococcus brunensis]ULG72608.1 Na+/H+ antiporter subunit E [Macrococcus brunensis]ULG74862.1 Na+/H+ antiporter subunit E [Macrococcus brunensis]
MAIQALINILLTVLWCLITLSFSFGNIVLGYLFGLFAVYVMRKFLPGRFYLRPFAKALRLGFIFLVELFKANLDVLKIVLAKKIDIEPAFFAYPTELTKDWEISLLSLLITLTPGTVVTAVSDDKKTLYIHAIDFSNLEDEIEGIRTSFEAAIKEVGVR